MFCLPLFSFYPSLFSFYPPFYPLLLNPLLFYLFLFYPPLFFLFLFYFFLFYPFLFYSLCLCLKLSSSLFSSHSNKATAFNPSATECISLGCAVFSLALSGDSSLPQLKYGRKRVTVLPIIASVLLRIESHCLSWSSWHKEHRQLKASESSSHDGWWCLWREMLLIKHSTQSAQDNSIS